MPVQLSVMSWNIQKKQTNAAYLAELMRAHQIDICVLLEVPSSLSFTIPFNITTRLNNLLIAYHTNDWRFHAVNVGNESVVYIWHESVAPANNDFLADLFTNAPLKRAGKVIRNAANQKIYFPTTGFKWARATTGRPSGRRPAYMAFVTNDGAAPRRFTVLNLHTPFNTSTFIQSYATHLYASSREILRVQRIDAASAASAVSALLVAGLAGIVDPLLTAVANYNNFVRPLAFRTAAVKGGREAIENAVAEEAADLPELLATACNDAINEAVKAIGAIPNGTIGIADVKNLAKACAMAGASAAVRMVAEVQLPTAPPAATANAATALTTVQANVTAVVSQYVHPNPKSAARIRDSIRTEAKRIARLALAPFAFPAAPQDNVDMAVIAGDFNVDYPDATGYDQAARNVLGGTNAYAALAAVAGAARINDTTTRIGPTAFQGARVYTLKNPSPIQNNNAALATYVPIDMTTLVNNPTSFMGTLAWTNGLKALPRGGFAWTAMENPPYADRINLAFDMEVINDTSFYRASSYDNIFVRGGIFIAGGMVDAMSALGSWGQPMLPLPNPRPGLAPNPWAGATGTLNANAQTQLMQANANLQFTYSGITYTITPQLSDAEEAAIFFDRFMSDHLPVSVTVQI
jgi:hypothetical protein